MSKAARAPVSPATSRMEHDALGAVAVPADALYGIQTMRALENLSFSGRPLGSCPPYVAALGTVKAAAARANREADVLTAKIATAIDAACDPLRAGMRLEQFPVDLLGGGGSIGINMNVNEVIANLATESCGGRRGAYEPVHPLRHVNASQSTADVCHTALRLAVLNEWPALKDVLGEIAGDLREKESTFARIPTLARTCLQDAFATSLGTLFGGYASLLQRRALELDQSMAGLSAIAFGGTVIGTGEAAPPRYRERVVPILAELTNHPFTPRDNRPDALQNSDDIGVISAQLAQLAQALSKLAHDLRLLASGPQGGFGEIVLPHVQAGSSFFAAKSNPVVAESLLQCCMQVLGCDRTVQVAVERAELYLNVFDGLAAINVLDALRMLTAALRQFAARCLRGLRANEARCRELAALGKQT